MSEAPKRRVRIINESDYPLLTRVVDADTGAEIHGICKLSLVIDANAYREGMVKATIEVLAEIDYEVDAEIKRIRLNDQTGKYQAIDP